MKRNNSRNIDVAYIILRDVLKNWFSIICIALSAAFLSYIFLSVSYTPKYTSRCTMVVSAKVNSSNGYMSANTAQRLTDTHTKRSLADSAFT